MKIALLFNQKADPGANQGATGYAFCEWDTPETIPAVACALRERELLRETVEVEARLGPATEDGSAIPRVKL